MLDWFRRMIPQSGDFFTLFERHSAACVAAAEALAKLTRGDGDAGKLCAAMRDQRIDQRAVRIARRRMHDKARGLLDDDEVLVLMDDGERNILCFRPGRAGLYAPPVLPHGRKDGFSG